MSPWQALGSMGLATTYLGNGAMGQPTLAAAGAKVYLYDTAGKAFCIKQIKEKLVPSVRSFFDEVTTKGD